MRLPLAGRPTRAAVVVVLGWVVAAVVAGFIGVDGDRCGQRRHRRVVDDAAVG